jgi:guanyl-specific ribonuclease Sa
MKTTCSPWLQFFAILILFLPLVATTLFADATNLNADTGFQVGQASFPHGDFIEITSVERSQNQMVVKGHYKLVSADRALLALYTTTRTAISVATDPTQLKTIWKGDGDFELTDPNLVPGMNHVTMYSIPGGKPFAGVYFGNHEEAAEESQLDLGYYQEATTTDAGAANRGKAVLASGPNQVLLDYLGEPVQPPADLDARYTKEGLINAIQLAAGKAGITVKKVAVDDSEFPFLVGVTCAGSDFIKLKAQIKKMDGYGYSGSVGNDANNDGSDTCNVFSLVPYAALPRESRQQTGHRLMLRQQVFYDRLNTQE